MTEHQHDPEVVEAEVVDDSRQDPPFDESEVVDAEIVEEDHGQVVESDLVETMAHVVPAILAQKLVVMRKEVVVDTFRFTLALIPVADQFLARNPHRDDLRSFVGFLNSGARPFVEQLVGEFLAGVEQDADRWSQMDVVVFTADEAQGVRVQAAPASELPQLARALGQDEQALLDWWERTTPEAPRPQDDPQP